MIAISQPTIRQAGINDIEFLKDAIIAAEKSGGDVLFYNAVFGLTETETRQLIHHVLDEDIEGQEWCISHFLIASIDGKPAACLSCWIEGESGQASGILKAQALSFFLRERWTNASAKLEKIKLLQLHREESALQLECIYTSPEFRGKGLIPALIDHALKLYPGVKRAEVQVMGNNDTAIRSYTKCGFLTDRKAHSADAELLTLLPGNTRISLKKDLQA